MGFNSAFKGLMLAVFINCLLTVYFYSTCCANNYRGNIYMYYTCIYYFSLFVLNFMLPTCSPNFPVAVHAAKKKVKHECLAASFRCAQTLFTSNIYVKYPFNYPRFIKLKSSLACKQEGLIRALEISFFKAHINIILKIQNKTSNYPFFP